MYECPLRRRVKERLARKNSSIEKVRAVIRTQACLKTAAKCMCDVLVVYCVLGCEEMDGSQQCS